MLRIFKLKIKFSFYDLPCSFPIKHSDFVSFLFIPCSNHLSLSLAHKQFLSPSIFLPYFIHSPVCGPLIFFLLLVRTKCTNARIPDAATAKEKEKKMYMFDWPKFLGANHICNYEIKDKQRHEVHTITNLCDWIRRKNKRIMRKYKSSPCFENKNRCWIFGLTIFKLLYIEFLFEQNIDRFCLDFIFFIYLFAIHFTDKRARTNQVWWPLLSEEVKETDSTCI